MTSTHYIIHLIPPIQDPAVAVTRGRELEKKLLGQECDVKVNENSVRVTILLQKFVPEKKKQHLLYKGVLSRADGAILLPPAVAAYNERRETEAAGLVFGFVKKGVVLSPPSSYFRTLSLSSLSLVHVVLFLHRQNLW